MARTAKTIKVIHVDLLERIPATCISCRFYNPYEADFGSCRCNPPTLILDHDTGEEIGGWPTVEPTDWCGKFVGKH